LTNSGAFLPAGTAFPTALLPKKVTNVGHLQTLCIEILLKIALDQEC
jgi:hypothetical protein